MGAIFALSYQNVPSGSDNVEFAWGKDSKGTIGLTDYQIRQYYLTRERQSYSMALDWTFGSNHTLTFKMIYNNRNDWENRYRLSLKDLNKSVNKGMKGAEIENKGKVRIQTKGGSPDNRNARLERQQTMDFTLGGEHLFDKLSVDWNASFARASETRPNERYITFESDKQTFDVDLTDLRFPLAHSAGMALNQERFRLQTLSEQQREIVEKDLKFSANFKLPLMKGFYSNRLKFGAKVVRKTKEKEVEFYFYEPTKSNKETFTHAIFANLARHDRKGFIPGEKYKAGNFVSKEYLGQLDLNNGALFNKTEEPEELAGEFKALETISAGYLRFDQHFGKKLELMVGVRLENTRLTYNGRKLTVVKGVVPTLETTPDVTDSYMNILPSFLLKYDVSEACKIRGSFTETISRPKYSALIPNVNINRKDDELIIGNPSLKPTVSFNYDLSADYYFESIGMVTFGLFYKDIRDFVVDQIINEYSYEGYTYRKFIRPKNAGNARLLGLEATVQRDFGFISLALKHIGFYGTYTYAHAKVNHFNFEGRENEKDLRLPGSPEHTANASLYYEKTGLNIRLSYNYASEFIDEMGVSPFYDRYYDKVHYMDFNIGYTFGKNFKTTLYAEANNLLNQPLHYFQGTSDYTMQSEHYGIKINTGIKIQF